jgi:hypothetical protein
VVGCLIWKNVGGEEGSVEVIGENWRLHFMGMRHVKALSG